MKLHAIVVVLAVRKQSPGVATIHGPDLSDCRYDVELYQRIEKLIGKKLEEFASEQELVLLLLERVSEAQRMATMQVTASDPCF